MSEGHSFIELFCLLNFNINFIKFCYLICSSTKMSVEKVLEALAAFDTNGEAQLSVASGQFIVGETEMIQPNEVLPQLGVEPALQEQLLSAIPPPSTTMTRPTPESTLPGEFPLSLLPANDMNEDAKVSIDKIEATISFNIPITTQPQVSQVEPLTDVVASNLISNKTEPLNDLLSLERKSESELNLMTTNLLNQTKQETIEPLSEPIKTEPLNDSIELKVNHSMTSLIPDSNNNPIENNSNINLIQSKHFVLPPKKAKFEYRSSVLNEPIKTNEFISIETANDQSLTNQMPLSLVKQRNTLSSSNEQNEVNAITSMLSFIKPSNKSIPCSVVTSINSVKLKHKKDNQTSRE